MAKKKGSRQKKMNSRVDFTPMVDMMMLLITFFMLCTTLSKPQTLQLTLPSNDKNINQEDQNEAKESQTLTVYIAGNDQVYVGAGIPKYDDATWAKKADWGSGKTSLREAIRNHVVGDGTTPVKKIMVAKNKLDKERKEKGEKMSQQEYDERLLEIKSGKLPDEVVPTLTIVIKCTDAASYKNMIDALDEMQICSIGTYVIDKINDNDQKLLDLMNVK